MAELKHSGGIIDVVLELGFDQVKYFEGDITSTASGFTINPPARRLQLTNRSDSNDVYFSVNGTTATPVVEFVPGDNIKLGPGCSFTMDYDILTELSLVTAGATVAVEGLLGWKGTSA
ncbi:hypothetical protein LCGC14_1609480 [marine sediment metagenome]|uniref:Uncharacterized protein n=1 Tax=marine sediment metagenome TaxID=412755 RepID=A0A0F9IVH6_9ZZZZ